MYSSYIIFFYRFSWQILVLITCCGGLTLASHKVPTSSHKLLYHSPSSGQGKGNTTKCSWLNIKTGWGRSLIHYWHGQNTWPGKIDLIICWSKVRSEKWEVKRNLKKRFLPSRPFFSYLTSFTIFFTSFSSSSTVWQKMGFTVSSFNVSLLLLPPNTLPLPQHWVFPMGDRPSQIAPGWILATNCSCLWTSCPHHHLVSARNLLHHGQHAT